jgi:hypothetical protein
MHMNWAATFGRLSIGSIVQQVRGGKRVLAVGCRTELTGQELVAPSSKATVKAAQIALIKVSSIFGSIL